MKRAFYMKASTLFHESRLVLHSSCGISSLCEGGEGKFAERKGNRAREEERDGGFDLGRDSLLLSSIILLLFLLSIRLSLISHFSFRNEGKTRGKIGKWARREGSEGRGGCGGR